MIDEQASSFNAYAPPAAEPVAQPAAAPAADVATLINQLTPEQQVAIVEHAQANGLTGEALREFIATSINQQSVNNEAHLAQGGYDAGVATAVAASVGVGADPEQIQQAAANFAIQAAAAIKNGLPPDKMPFDDPRLTADAKQAIYEQVAQQQGTSADEVARKAEEARQADMAALQTGMGMLVGGALLGAGAGVAAAPLAATNTEEKSGFNLFAPAQPANEYGITAEQRLPFAPASLASLGALVPANVPDVREPELARGQGGWSMA